MKFILDEDFQNFYSDLDQDAYLEEITKGDSIFKLTDSQYIRQQIDESKTFKISQQFIKGRSVIPKDKVDSLMKSSHEDFWKNLYKEYKADKFMIISMPIFSRDYKTCMVMIEHHTYSGGGGALLVFKKPNETWTLTHQLRFWDI